MSLHIDPNSRRNIEVKGNESDPLPSGVNRASHHGDSATADVMQLSSQIIKVLCEEQDNFRKQLAAVQTEIAVLRRSIDQELAFQAEQASEIDTALGRVTVLEQRVKDLAAEMGQAEEARDRASAAHDAANRARQANPSSKKKTELNRKLPGLRQANSAAHDKCQKLEKELRAAQDKLGEARSRLTSLQERAKPPSSDWQRRLERALVKEHDLQLLFDRCGKMMEKEREENINRNQAERESADVE